MGRVGAGPGTLLTRGRKPGAFADPITRTGPDRSWPLASSEPRRALGSSTRRTAVAGPTTTRSAAPGRRRWTGGSGLLYRVVRAPDPRRLWEQAVVVAGVVAVVVARATNHQPLATVCPHTLCNRLSMAGSEPHQSGLLHCQVLPADLPAQGYPAVTLRPGVAAAATGSPRSASGVAVTNTSATPGVRERPGRLY